MSKLEACQLFLKLLSKCVTVWLRLFRRPTFVQVLFPFLGLLTVVDYRVAEEEPEVKYRQGIYLPEIISGIVPDDLLFQAAY